MTEKSKDQATKRPWYLAFADSDDPETLKECSGIFSNGCICPVVNNADAKLIVTAVNCHDELVEALEYALNIFKNEGRPVSAIIKLEQALLHAKGGE